MNPGQMEAPGFQQPIGWGERATIADPSLPHQIQLVNVPGSSRIAVKCNCGGLSDYVSSPDGDAQWIYAEHLAELATGAAS